MSDLLLDHSQYQVSLGSHDGLLPLTNKMRVEATGGVWRSVRGRGRPVATYM